MSSSQSRALPSLLKRALLKHLDESKDSKRSCTPKNERAAGRPLNLAAKASTSADDEDVRAHLGASVMPRLGEQRAIRVGHADQPFGFRPRFLPWPRLAALASADSRAARCAGVSFAGGSPRPSSRSSSSSGGTPASPSPRSRPHRAPAPPRPGRAAARWRRPRRPRRLADSAAPPSASPGVYFGLVTREAIVRRAVGAIWRSGPT